MEEWKEKVEVRLAIIEQKLKDLKWYVMTIIITVISTLVAVLIK